MTIDLDAVHLGRGLAQLEFGATIPEACGLLGSPSAEEVNEYGDTQLQFEEHRLSLTFWGEFDNRLGCILTERATAKLGGVRLIGMSEPEVEQFIREQLVAEIAERNGCEHDDGCIQTWIDCDTHGLVFWFEQGRLYGIDWMCAWNDDEQPVWLAGHLMTAATHQS